MATMILSYKYRLLPTKKQHAALERILEDQRQLYNAALQERIDCYRLTRRGITYVDQCKSLSEWRKSDDEARAMPLNIQRWTIRRVDLAFAAFFSRVKKKTGRAGYPRFRSFHRWKSFGFNEFEGVRLIGRRIHFRGMPGSLRVHMHRQLPEGLPRSCSLSRDRKGWYVSLQMRISAPDTKESSTFVGIDLGLTTLAALSDGSMVENPRMGRKSAKMIRRLSRALSLCKRGSRRRQKVRQRLARQHERIGAQRETYLHQVTAKIMQTHDLIAIEKLNVKGLAKSNLARSVNDASWNILREMLAYKAERAGCQLIEVDPRYTSQTCPECGQIKPKTLSQRLHECDCGCVLDRDVAAARVILSRAVACPEVLKTAESRISAPGNIGSLPSRYFALAERIETLPSREEGK